tara:strand:+ start:174 stop:437 length:264 start_codon:yes stop_codon:yes gene_type:complete
MGNNTTEKEILEQLLDREGKTWDAPIDNLDINSTNFQSYPDAKTHQLISFIKSGIRITGYVFIPFNLWVACLVLILSEVVGIIEELV